MQVVTLSRLCCVLGDFRMSITLLHLDAKLFRVFWFLPLFHWP